MTSANSQDVRKLTAEQLRKRITDRVRAERYNWRLSQKEFAERAGIALRTFKRFELGACDSLEVFLRIVVVFERANALELLFPPKPSTTTNPHSPVAALERFLTRVNGPRNMK